MNSDNTLLPHCAFQTPSCPQRGISRAQNKLNRSCLWGELSVAQRTAALPFLKELRTADYRAERTKSCGMSSCQVYAEEVHRPCYSLGDMRPARWDWPSDCPHTPCMGVREIRRECGCVQRWYYPEHPFNESHALSHPRVKGQQYREVLYVSNQHYRGHDEAGNTDLQEPWRNNLHTPAFNAHCQRRRVSFQNDKERHRLDSPETSRQSSPNKPNCGQAAFFPTEVPQSQLKHSKPREPTLKVKEVGRDISAESLENHDNWRKSQRTVREQIKRVVSELEEVLGGLKQVQLEMKEVVQQIDVLTSNIDLCEEKPASFRGLLQSSQTDAVAQNSPKAQSHTTPETSCIAHGAVTLDSVLQC